MGDLDELLPKRLLDKPVAAKAPRCVLSQIGRSLFSSTPPAENKDDDIHGSPMATEPPPPPHPFLPLQLRLPHRAVSTLSNYLGESSVPAGSSSFAMRGGQGLGGGGLGGGRAGGDEGKVAEGSDNIQSLSAWRASLASSIARLWKHIDPISAAGHDSSAS